jgi:hypothetical protein
MTHELRISGTGPETVTDRSGPTVRREYRAPVVEIASLPVQWWMADRSEIAGLREAYPVMVSIGDFGANVVPNEQVLALADEFERASVDTRLGAPTRLGLAARLLRRFAGRVAQVKVPGP